MSQLTKGNPELLGHEIANRPAHVEKKSVGHVAILGNPPRERGKVKGQIVAAMLFELLAKGARPVGLLAAFIGAEFVAVDVQVLQDVRPRRRDILKRWGGGVLHMAFDAGAVEHVGLVTALGVNRRRTNLLPQQRVPEAINRPPAGRHVPSQSARRHPAIS